MKTLRTIYLTVIHMLLAGCIAFGLGFHNDLMDYQPQTVPEYIADTRM